MRVNSENIRIRPAFTPTDHFECQAVRAQWYAIYTRSRYEKRVDRLLRDKGVETFLPLREVRTPLSRWRTRTGTIPLFPGYLFAKFTLQSDDYDHAMSTTGVVYVVGSHNEPTPISEQEINSLGILVGHHIECEPFPYLKVGRFVTINDGPLRGLTGRLIQRKRKEFFVVSIEILGRAVAVELRGSQLDPWVRGPR